MFFILIGQQELHQDSIKSGGQRASRRNVRPPLSWSFFRCKKQRRSLLMDRSTAIRRQNKEGEGRERKEMSSSTQEDSGRR